MINDNRLNFPIAKSIMITADQQKFVKGWSIGAFLLGPLYFFASGMTTEGFLFLIPIYNIYLLFQGLINGRKMAWEKGRWPDFDTYKKRQKLLDTFGIGYIGISLIYGFFIFGLTFKLTAAPVESSKIFLNDLYSGNIETAYTETSSQFKSIVTEDSFKNYLSKHPILTRVQKTSFFSREIDNSTGRISGTITANDGTSSSITFVFDKENDQWRVSGLGLEYEFLGKKFTHEYNSF